MMLTARPFVAPHGNGDVLMGTLKGRVSLLQCQIHTASLL